MRCQISSSLASEIFSSCLWRRASSPEIRVPRSRPSPFSRPRRSRRWSSASPGIVREQSEYPAEVGTEIPTADDSVEVSEAKVGLGEAEVLRQLLARRLLNDARAREREQRARF